MSDRTPYPQTQLNRDLLKAAALRYRSPFESESNHAEVRSQLEN